MNKEERIAEAERTVRAEKVRLLQDHLVGLLYQRDDEERALAETQREIEQVGSMTADEFWALGQRRGLAPMANQNANPYAAISNPLGGLARHLSQGGA